MAGIDRATLAVVGSACAICCLPLIVAAGPVVVAGGAVAAVAGGAAHVARRARRTRPTVTPRDAGSA